MTLLAGAAPLVAHAADLAVDVWVRLAAHAATTAAWTSRVPLEPTREEGRRLAAEELSRREYAAQRPGLLERVLDWLGDRFGGSAPAVDRGTGTAFALVAGVVLVVVVVAVLVTGRVLLRARQEEPAAVFDGVRRPASAHRAAADAAAAREDWRTAVVERFRAVVRELEDRAVLVPQPGRTADEAAAEASRLLPVQAGALNAAARLFDDVRYGDRDADAAGDGALRRLDDAVRRARVAVAAAGPAGGTAGAVR